MANKHMKKCLTSLGKYKTTVRYQFTSIRMAKIKKKRRTKTCIGEDVKKSESLYTADGNVNWHSHHEKLYGGPSKK